MVRRRLRRQNFTNGTINTPVDPSAQNNWKMPWAIRPAVQQLELLAKFSMKPVGEEQEKSWPCSFPLNRSDLSWKVPIVPIVQKFQSYRIFLTMEGLGFFSLEVMDFPYIFVNFHHWGWLFLALTEVDHGTWCIFFFGPPSCWIWQRVPPRCWHRRDSHAGTQCLAYPAEEVLHHG